MDDTDVRTALHRHVTVAEPPLGLTAAGVISAGRRDRRKRALAAWGAGLAVAVAGGAAVTLAPGPAPEALGGQRAYPQKTCATPIRSADGTEEMRPVLPFSDIDELGGIDQFACGLANLADVARGQPPGRGWREEFARVEPVHPPGLDVPRFFVLLPSMRRPGETESGTLLVAMGTRTESMDAVNLWCADSPSCIRRTDGDTTLLIGTETYEDRTGWHERHTLYALAEQRWVLVRTVDPRGAEPLLDEEQRLALVTAPQLLYG